jgi:hypothetical protein
VNRGSMLGGGDSSSQVRRPVGNWWSMSDLMWGAKPAELAHCHLMCTLRSTAAFEPVAIQPEPISMTLMWDGKGP